ncbi:MAG: hypothetical protein KGY40_08910, partial [Thioalkalivibrio sp.]|nr:hypothetical protein [Thioalkalivibrio sp.]
AFNITPRGRVGWRVTASSRIRIPYVDGLFRQDARGQSGTRPAPSGPQGNAFRASGAHFNAIRWASARIGALGLLGRHMDTWTDSLHRWRR